MIGPRIAVGLAVAVLVSGVGLIGSGVVKPGAFMDDPLDVETFDSRQDFVSYLEESPSTLGGFTSRAQSAQDNFQGQAETGSGGTTVDRYSTTNVQEEGIQEPDILKTDGEHFYMSPQGPSFGGFVGGGRVRPSIYYPYDRVEPNTSIINTLPVTNMTEQAEIEGNGRMLLYEDTLIQLRGDAVKAFDVSDPSSPSQAWNRSINGSIVAARRQGGTVYLVVEQSIDTDRPCPIRPTASVTVDCTEVYHPKQPVSTDTTYTVLELEAGSGEVTDSTSLVGSSRRSVVYMADDAIYVTYLERESEIDIFIDFMLEEATDIISDEVERTFRNLSRSDVDRMTKYRRLSGAWENFTRNMSFDERQRIQEKLRNRLGNYTKEHRREFASTGIIRVGIGDGVTVEETGKVPGVTLDQFSMDAYQGRLRIATTVGTFGSLGTGTSTANDVYVLNEDLSVQGSVKGMGLTERIYAVRFIRDKGYVVTFRRVDPFHVLDLSDPSNPELQGTLKLPGFSSYLHPLDEDRILGVGEEDGQVKVVVFDVSDPSSPSIADQTVLEGYSSEIGRTHHAFLIDRKHKVFFVPGGDGGYVFSYDNGLDRVMTVNLSDPVRARYVNNYLYVFSERKVAVINESSWKQVNTMRFREEPERDPYDPPTFDPEPTRGLTSDLNLSRFTLVGDRIPNGDFSDAEMVGDQNVSIAGWTATNGKTGYIRTRDGRLDGQSIGTGWIQNGFGDTASISTQVNLSGIEAIGLDAAGTTGNPHRSKIVLEVDGARQGTFITSPEYNMTYQNLGVALNRSYTGMHTLTIRWDQVTGDNLGNSYIDSVRAYR
ncbi:MAG: beta-propeller domain-containing protein [Candidatus Nanohaloarchaea archaeon]|nr:beta-propeller domain-containing protein [Candidatus Nanohaloarchaea archaeon]